MESTLHIAAYPVTKDRWEDFQNLFGERGACAGCWCMYWRLSHSEFQAQKGGKNKSVIKTIIKDSSVPGIIGYLVGKPIGWCSVAPRNEFPRLERSRILKRIDDKPVWSIVCLFIDKNFRNQGISIEMIKAASAYAATQGANIVEGYPVDPHNKSYPPVFAYTGIASAFIKAGFREVGRNSPKRPIMRYYIR
ncbi:MAG TPA: GNAT family N-acetyltransferase [Balneolales bacterium]|nr:GNAT family N-acetyltransferase [Balneolales bacterium]